MYELKLKTPNSTTGIYWHSILKTPDSTESHWPSFNLNPKKSNITHSILKSPNSIKSHWICPIFNFDQWY